MAAVIPTHSKKSKLHLRIWLEVGYACDPQRRRGAVPEWRVWLRGVTGAAIAPFMYKVVFRLRPENKFSSPERVVEEPPYQVKESGVAPTDVLISVYLKYTMQPEAFRFQYGPLLQNPDNCRADSTCMFYDVKYPTRLLQSALRTSKKTASHNTGNTLTLLPNDDEVPPIRPMLHKRILELRYPTKRGNSRKKAAKRVIEFKLRKNLELAPPFQAELQHINQMCLAQSLYEKSGKALQLPPLWDPLYQLPVLPESLRRMLPTGQPDHVLT